MRELLGARYPEYKEAYDVKPRFKALRVNTRKISEDGFLAVFGALRQNPLCPQSFFCDVKPSADPLYHAGLYYMQEPSASAAVSAFSPFIGRRVLDLCAAPGGKSTQAAAFMDDGVIFCNDPEYKRVRALSENIERLGVSNAVITRNTARDYVSAGFRGFFDTLIVDAPCSGGGMSRYESVPYTEDIVKGCAARQKQILDDAVTLLAADGYMLYSTCTFSREENENNIKYLRSLGLATVDIPLRDGEERGIDEPHARRIYPHNADGEGHFFCVLHKPDGECNRISSARRKRVDVRLGDALIEAYDIGGRTVLPIDMPPTAGLNVIRTGTPVYAEREFAHALSHALTPEQIAATGATELGDAANAYIRGEQLDIAAPYGLRIATVRGFALGFARSARSGDGSTALKNLYPKYLRI